MPIIITVLLGGIRMADGVTKRIAVIVNGDTEPRHLRNVELAIADNPNLHDELRSAARDVLAQRYHP